MNLKAGKYVLSHCTSVSVTRKLQRGAARQKQVRKQRPSSLCCREEDLSVRRMVTPPDSDTRRLLEGCDAVRAA